MIKGKVKPSDPDKNRGLYGKYKIEKADGSPMNHPKADFFVLRLDIYQKDLIHREACLRALRTYADSIKNHLPKLYTDLYEIYNLKNH